MKPISILHLSDLHFGAPGGYATAQAQALIREICNGPARTHEAAYLVVTGNSSYRASRSGFAEASSFLKILAERLEIRPGHVIMTPGNHDLDWPEEGDRRFEPFRRFVKSTTGDDWDPTNRISHWPNDKLTFLSLDFLTASVDPTSQDFGNDHLRGLSGDLLGRSLEGHTLLALLPDGPSTAVQQFNHDRVPAGFRAFLDEWAVDVILQGGKGLPVSTITETPAGRHTVLGSRSPSLAAWADEGVASFYRVLTLERDSPGDRQLRIRTRVNRQESSDWMSYQEVGCDLGRAPSRPRLTLSAYDREAALAPNERAALMMEVCRLTPSSLDRLVASMPPNFVHYRPQVEPLVQFAARLVSYAEARGMLGLLQRAVRDALIRPGHTQLRVFLASAASDHDEARTVAEYLGRHGFDVWYDVDRLAPGQQVSREISRALRSADLMVVLLSPAAVRSGSVMTELAAWQESRGVSRLAMVVKEAVPIPADVSMGRLIRFEDIARGGSGFGRALMEMSTAS